MRRTRMWRCGVVAALLVACLLAGGCSYVTRADRRVIHDHWLNARAIAGKVAVDPNCPPYAKVWWEAEAETWRAMDAWARGEAASPAAEDKDK